MTVKGSETSVGSVGVVGTVGIIGVTNGGSTSICNEPCSVSGAPMVLVAEADSDKSKSVSVVGVKVRPIKSELATVQLPSGLWIPADNVAPSGMPESVIEVSSPA